MAQLDDDFMADASKKKSVKKEKKDGKLSVIEKLTLIGVGFFVMLLVAINFRKKKERNRLWIKKLAYILAFVLIASGFYLLTAFVNWEIDCSKWSVLSRYAYSYLSIGICVFYVFIRRTK